MAQTNERDFERYVETILLEKAGWTAGEQADWDEARALVLISGGASTAHRPSPQQSTAPR
jgi:hypothetical protein